MHRVDPLDLAASMHGVDHAGLGVDPRHAWIEHHGKAKARQNRAFALQDCFEALPFNQVKQLQ